MCPFVRSLTLRERAALCRSIVPCTSELLPFHIFTRHRQHRLCLPRWKCDGHWPATDNAHHQHNPKNVRILVLHTVAHFWRKLQRQLTASACLKSSPRPSRSDQSQSLLWLLRRIWTHVDLTSITGHVSIWLHTTMCMLTVCRAYRIECIWSLSMCFLMTSTCLKQAQVLKTKQSTGFAVDCLPVSKRKRAPVLASIAHMGT